MNVSKRALACLVVPATVLLAACGQSGENAVRVAQYDGISESETFRFTGTEPFWGGEVAGSSLTYTAPENPDGVTISVERFAGNGGLGLSGALDGEKFDMAVTPGECSDGMSDRTYPFVVTLQLGEETRNGCGWTDANMFIGPQAP